MTPEGRVKEYIKAWLEREGAWHCMPVTGGWGRRLVDILAVLPAPPCPCCGRRGDFVAIEVKQPGKDARKFQRRILEQIATAGGYGFSVDSVERLRELVHNVVRPPRQRDDLPHL